MSMKEVPRQELTKELGEELKDWEEIQAPDWSHFVKTGPFKERPPDQSDWWYLRAGSILRRVFEDGPIGVSKLRSLYGGRKNRGSAPEKVQKGSGKIIRTILQQLEGAELVTKTEERGRKISSNGMSLLSQVSDRLLEED